MSLRRFATSFLVEMIYLQYQNLGGYEMGTELEIRKEQKRRLMILLRIQQGKIPLDQAIIDLQAEMEQEDVAYVEKLANEK